MAILCPKCRHENPDEPAFCGRCGAALKAEEGFPETKTLVTPPPTISKDTLIAGKYKIVEEIGRGGMGIVYKAEDLRLQRTVALKFLPPNLADSAELKERFLIEARAAAALSHPNICVIHEVGESEDRPYIAMEYVEGETLRDRIKKKPLTTEDALSIASQVAAGLGEAHRKDIVHRDIKSANIMVTNKGQAKVMDFGLAKLRGGSSLTKSQTTLGTVAYMSPEQARGEEVDGRTDIWSLGVVLYEMLTGELPFKGDRDLSIIHSIVHEDPRPIKIRKPPVPLELQQVVARTLKKKREARYGSAEEILKDLKAYETSLQLERSGAWSLKTLVRRLRRPAVAVPTVLAVAAVSVLAVWFFNRQDKIRWAKQVALPEIERMIADNDVWRDLVAPYRLAEKAEAIIPRDPKLAELFSKCSVGVDIKIEPPGANIYIKDYDKPESEWEYLGVSPLEKARLPIGIFRWKFEKEGYESVLAAASTWKSVAVSSDRKNVAYDLVRTLDRVGSIPPGMVRVPATDLSIGKLEDFFIGRYEVTNRQFKEFVDKGGYRNKEYWKHPFVKDGKGLSWEEAMSEFVDPTDQPGPATWSAGDYPEGLAEYPVSGVSWYEAAAYAEYAGMSLPTSAHWNVARGGVTPMIQTFQLGGFAVLAAFSNFGGSGPVPVGSLQGWTVYGAFDMAGNVREWCSNEAPAGRVIRGGAWEDNTYEFGNVRQAPAMDRSARNGFRCALYPDPEKIPGAAFQFEKIAVPKDFSKETPVPDSVFQFYREQFSYDKTDLNARMEYREESPGGWIREKISFDAAYGGERVVAYLFLPKNARSPYQTVIYFPGSAATRQKSSDDLENYYEFSMFISFLVKNGRAVLFPVYKGTFERSDPALAEIHPGRDTYAYTEFLIQLVKDFRRCVDYLETRPDIDSGNLAYYGMSWGGALGAIIPAVEERLKVSVLLAGGLSTQTQRPEASPINYVIRVKMPTLMVNGKYDAGLEIRVKPMYDLLGTPVGQKDLKLYETDHIPPRTEYIRDTLAWLDKYLGPVKK